MRIQRTMIHVTAALLLWAVPALADHQNPETFVPYRGTSTIGQDSTSRYTQQFMYWRGYGLTAYAEYNDTYEHETVFYAYGDHPGPYATGGGTWETTLPDPYLDTGAGDKPGEENVAIGTFDPNIITTGVWQSYHVRLNSTSHTTSLYKISGQTGNSWCEIPKEPWCVLDNHQTATLIPFRKGITAPERRNYRYEWEGNGNTALADEIFLGDWGTGVVSSTTDEDYFKFSVPSARTVQFLLKVSTIQNVDYDVDIYNTAGVLVAYGVNGAGADEEFSKYLTAGTYYARIRSYAGSNTFQTYGFLAR